MPTKRGPPSGLRIRLAARIGENWRICGVVISKKALLYTAIAPVPIAKLCSPKHFPSASCGSERITLWLYGRGGQNSGRPVSERKNAHRHDRHVHSEDILFPDRYGYIRQLQINPTDIFGVLRCGGSHACFGGFLGDERYMGINCEDNASTRQARRNDRNLEGELSRYARVSQLRCGQRRC